MNIKGAEGLSLAELNEELRTGGDLIVYEYCVSVLVMTFKRNSAIYLIRNGESEFTKGMIYTIISIMFGWWGFPWGPIYTIVAILTNCKGGKNVTNEIINSLNYNQTTIE